VFSPKGRTEQGGLRVSSCSSLSSLFQVRTRMQSGLSPPPTPTPGLPAQCLMLGRQAVVVSAQWSFKILGVGGGGGGGRLSILTFLKRGETGRGKGSQWGVYAGGDNLGHLKGQCHEIFLCFIFFFLKSSSKHWSAVFIV